MVLKDLLGWLTEKHEILSFYWEGDIKGIKGNKIFLPLKVAVENNFYEYKFLEMQTSGIMMPNFDE